MFYVKLCSWPSNFRGEDFFKFANNKQELPVANMFKVQWDKMRKLCKGPPIDTSCKV